MCYHSRVMDGTQTDRSEILQYLRAALPPDGVGTFCFVCGAPGVRSEETPEGEMFICPANGHRSARSFLFDGRATFWFEGDVLVHEATGAVIRRQAGTEKQTLLFLRQKYPFLYTIPAGHVELGQEPEQEMRREVAEETGLHVFTASQLWPGEPVRMEDPCRRGADIHHWHVYEVTAEGQLTLSDEGRVIGWYRDDEIQELAARQKLTLPTHQILTRMGILPPGGPAA